MLKSIVVVAAAAWLSGCAAPASSPPVSITEPTPVCTNSKQCEAMWAKVPDALEMVTLMRVRTYTDSVVDTFPPPRNRVAMYGRAVKTPLPSGGYSINADLQCRSAALCDRLYGQAINLFNATVTGAGEPFADRRK